MWNAKAIFLSEKLQNMYDDHSEYILLLNWVEGKQSSRTFKASSSTSLPAAWGMLLFTPNQSSSAEPPDYAVSAPSVDCQPLWETLLYRDEPFQSPPLKQADWFACLRELRLVQSPLRVLLAGVESHRKRGYWSGAIWLGSVEVSPRDIGTSPLWRSVWVTLLAVL